jgi:hypothetical protein
MFNSTDRISDKKIRECRDGTETLPVVIARGRKGNCQTGQEEKDNRGLFPYARHSPRTGFITANDRIKKQEKRDQDRGVLDKESQTAEKSALKKQSSFFG